MTSIATPVRPRQSGRRGRIAVVIVAVLSIAVVLAAVPRYLIPGDVNPAVEIRDDVAIHLPFLIVHAATAGLALLIGPLQFFGSIRRRHPKIHRLIGRSYLLAGILPAALSGIVVAVLTTAGPLAMASFVVLDAAWLYTGWRAYRAVRARDFAEHERWMLRNMALTFAAVMLRVYLGLYIFAQLPILESAYGGDFDALFAVAYNASIVSSIVFNWLFMELYLRRKRSRLQISVGAA